MFESISLPHYRPDCYMLQLNAVRNYYTHVNYVFSFLRTNCGKIVIVVVYR